LNEGATSLVAQRFDQVKHIVRLSRCKWGESKLESQDAHGGRRLGVNVGKAQKRVADFGQAIGLSWMAKQQVRKFTNIAFDQR
jgi:hypothetical protein